MSGLRYRNTEVCEHLASQYVAGTQSKLVKQRMEKLMESTPELQAAVAFWADQFSEVQARLPQQQPSEHVWHVIKKQTQPVNTASSKSLSWWHSLAFWRMAGISSFASVMLCAYLLLFNSVQPLPVGPDYMAVMSAEGSENIEFVITAYKKTEEQASRLELQWTQEKTSSRPEALHLWAEDKSNGQLTYIGIKPKQGWDLNKALWQAVTNSRRLIVTRNAQTPVSANTLFAGPCIQLKSWQAETS